MMGLSSPASRLKSSLRSGWKSALRMKDMEVTRLMSTLGTDSCVLRRIQLRVSSTCSLNSPNR